MNNPNICDLIQHSSLTSDLSEAQCSDLSSVAAARSLDDKEVLIEQGQIDETLHIVSSGALTVERVTAGGETVTLHILRPGDLAGEMGFVDGTEHTATLRAMGPTSVISIERKNLELLLSSKPEVVYALMRGIVRTAHRILREMNQQSVELSNYITKAHGRY
ncbi:MAG: cyclic nucleotide-binding domain-containing protein [Gammaproteobacteria bacterium]|nr:cyclic nucleotide-binding domain-containing protein [Gammaproteobacteria bacterium]